MTQYMVKDICSYKFSCQCKQHDFVRSVHTGSGVKNVVCAPKRWRPENPELDVALRTGEEACNSSRNCVTVI